MSLNDKSLSEMVQLRSKLVEMIARNPEHSGLERVELEDVEGFLELRRRETARRELLDSCQFDSADQPRF